MHSLTPRLQTLVARRNSWWSRSKYGADNALYMSQDWDPQSVSLPEREDEEHVALWRARQLQAFLQQIPVVINEEELIVGRAYGPFWMMADRQFVAQDLYKEGISVVHNLGHTIVDLEWGMRLGLYGIQALYNERLIAAQDDGEDECVIEYLQAQINVCDTIVNYAKRYADLAEKLAIDEPSMKRQRELMQIAEICRRVPAYSPRNFHEALQWLMFYVTIEESASSGTGHGQIDQYLYPYYLMSRDTLGQTREYLFELLVCFFLKYTRFIGIGGADADGNDLSNELSHLILRAYDLIGGTSNIAIRYHPNTDQKLIEYGCDILRRKGSGTPIFINDDVIIRELMSNGISHKEAARYGFGGCFWYCIPGKEFSYHDLSSICLARILEIALWRGKQRECVSYEGFVNLYKDELHHALQRMHDAMDQYFEQIPSVYPELVVSLLMPCCLSKGRDATDGGAKYYGYTLKGTGLPDVVNSLFAMKKLVFEQGLIPLDELFEALGANFQGFDHLRHRLLSASKFGQDNDEVDEVAIQLAYEFFAEVRSLRNAKGFSLRPVLYSHVTHVGEGNIVGALPSGRRRGMPLAHGINPTPNTTTNVIEVMQSVCKIDLSASAGAPIQFRLHPTAINGYSGTELLKALVTTFFQMGGLQFNCNIVDRKTLEAAYENPDDYRDLVIRITGYSDYFVTQEKAIQREIIARTEYNAD